MIQSIEFEQNSKLYLAKYFKKYSNPIEITIADSELSQVELAFPQEM